MRVTSESYWYNYGMTRRGMRIGWEESGHKGLHKGQLGFSLTERAGKTRRVRDERDDVTC